MEYRDYEKALSVARIGKYLSACRGDEDKALTLYRCNIRLCQTFYGSLGMLEVVLRNAVNEHFRTQFGDATWLVTQAQNGFLIQERDAILSERDKLKGKQRYSHDDLVSSLNFGLWTFLFSKNCYKNSGKTLLNVFPNKVHGMNQKSIYSELDKIRKFRNRIAHYESLCFDSNGDIGIKYAQEIYDLIIKYISFLGYDAAKLLVDVESPLKTITEIDALGESICSLSGAE